MGVRSTNYSPWSKSAETNSLSLISSAFKRIHFVVNACLLSTKKPKISEPPSEEGFSQDILQLSAVISEIFGRPGTVGGLNGL